LRGRDLDSNQNLRTRYYAMIDTARFRFNGAASDVPDYPSPSTVAAGGAQRNARNYDHYLLAHELGHTLGRLHPGACYGQIKEDKDYPYCSKNGTGNNRQAEAENEDTGCDGYISDKVKQHIGVDLTSEGTIKRLLNYDKWRDLMTYCDKKWISDYTYEGILDRIREEENLKIPPKGQYTKIIGIYDLRSKTGQILYAFPTIFDESISQDEVIDGKRVKLVLENQQEIEIESLRIGLKRREAKDLPDLTGVFQCTINRDQEVRYLRVDAGSKRNSEKYAIGWLTGSDVSEIEKISLNPFRTGAFANSMLNVDLSSDMPDLINPVYTVRVKENGKVEEIHERWHTIYLGTRFPTKVHLDPEVFPLDEAHSLKVTLSDGLDEIELFDGMISEKSPGADSAGDRP
ncbi:MAG: hypothetical protein HKN25_14210, partial [Pyrinomonadaceae bacterium]|nr:hypothetical protein [Pyrinomonadaceae bacterium]